MRVNAESIIFVLITSLLLVCSACGAAQVSSTAIPVCFIQNNGQTDDQVLYFADAAGYTVYLTKNGGVISTADPLTAVQITYQGSDPLASPRGEDVLPGKANFLIGNDESAWIRGVPLFASVRYEGLYPGTDLVYHGGPGSLKSEYVLFPGADPSLVSMQYSGQEDLSLDEDGNLLVTTAAGTFMESAPYAYQIVDGQPEPVSCSFVITEGDIVSFSSGAYNMELPLVIDPVYNFSTYLGGTRDDRGTGVGMDNAGDVYVVGSTQSTEFPLANSPPYQQNKNGSWDIFASKFSSNGSQLLYSTYIGGNKTDMAAGMVVNNTSGEVTFTGFTESANYPDTLGGVYGGSTDAIITRLNADGTDLVWSRFIYGNKSDYGTGIAMYQSSGQTVVVGYTNTPAFPPWPVTNSFSGATDGFVAEFENDGNVKASMGFRYLGGTNYDYAYGVAVEQNSPWDIWVTGETKSLNFPTTPVNPPYPFRSSNYGGSDAFITDLLWSDLSIRTSTYIGGSSNDVARGIALDPDNYPYITGYTESPISPINLFPILPNPTAFQTSFGGGQWDAFVTKMERNLSRMNYSTYLGGSDDDKAYGIAVDANGTAFVTGWTMSTNFPPKCPTQATKGIGFRVPDAFITQMNQTGTGLIFSTYLGGTYFDEGDAIAVTSDGLNITVTGYTESIDFPKKNAYQPYLAGFPEVRFTDAFVTKIEKIPPVANFTAIPPKGCSPAQIMFMDNSTNNPNKWHWEFDDNTTSEEQNPIHIFNNTGTTAKNFTVNLTVFNCDGSNTTSRNVTICPNLWYNFTSDNAGDPLPRGCLNTNATFEFTGHEQSGGPWVSPYWWFDFGDNTTGSYPVPGNWHTFTNTSNFTVTFWVQNECCNNSSTMVVDIRQEPVANFTANQTSGLVPLPVQFFDNSTGRPSSWKWLFGTGDNSTDQNPVYTYFNKGSYRVKLQACNFCGCNWSNKSHFINAGAPNLYFSPEPLIVPTNDTTLLALYLEVAENGLSGYDLDVFWGDSLNGNITAVDFPFWAANTSNTTLPDFFVQIIAVDLFNQTTANATNVTLATFNLTGRDYIPTYPSSIWFNVSVNNLTDDDGQEIDTTSIPAQITVVRLLPFPGMNSTAWPTDPDPTQPQIYWDVNGNGHVDFADVVLYFNNMQWIRDNQYIPFFDYNGNLQIDFADLIMLFNKVPYP